MGQVADKFYRTKTINDKKYQVNVLPAMEALKMGRMLANVIMPAVGGILDGMRDDGLNGPPRNFTDLALTLCTQLNSFDLDYVVLGVLKGATCNSSPIDPNIHFQGELGEMVAVLEFALKENFSSFFTGNALIAQLQEKLETMMDTGSQE